MVVQRGDIWWSSLPEPEGSGPGYPRPVLVIQSNLFNLSEINTIVVAVISKNTKLANAEGNVLITKQRSKLPDDSVVNVPQLFTVDEVVLSDYVCSLSVKKMMQVDIGLRKVLSL